MVQKGKGEGIPKYLMRVWGENRWRRIMRFRLGNEILEGRYWEEENKKICRLCRGGIGDMGARVEEVQDVERRGRGWQKACGGILGVEGEGEWWLREIKEERRGGGEKRMERKNGGIGGEEREEGNKREERVRMSERECVCMEVCMDVEEKIRIKTARKWGCS